jgi:hypothetical protein
MTQKRYFMRNILSDNKGQGMVDYVIVVLLICIIGVASCGQDISNWFKKRFDEASKPLDKQEYHQDPR